MIWRRLLVSDNSSLAELHKIIQISMGWEGYHLWTFSINGREYGHAYGGGPTREAHDHRPMCGGYVLERQCHEQRKAEHHADGNEGDAAELVSARRPFPRQEQQNTGESASYPPTRPR